MAVEITLSDATVARRREWLAASHALGQHIDDCLSCLVQWLPDCQEATALRAAERAAWTRYEAAPEARP